MRRLWEAPLTILLVALVGLAGLWWRGPQPDLRRPSVAHTEQAASLIELVTDYLAGRSAGGGQTVPPGEWYVTVYPRAGGEGVSVMVRGPIASWAGPLRGVWPGWIQVDRALEDPPSPRAGPWGFGLEVGLDGWIESTGRVHVPVGPMLAGLDRRALAQRMAERPGRSLRTNAWIGTAAGPAWLLRYTIDPGPLDAATLRRRITLAADYLVRHVGPDGRFAYEWDARAGAARPGYNLVRHAGTAYSLFQAARVTGNDLHARAAARAMATLELDRRADSSDPRRCFVVEGNRVKLGAAALALLALTEQARYESADAQLEWMRCLAEHIVGQTEESGDMASYYDDGGRYQAEGRRSAYYPGEAVLALTRLHGIDPDPRWLETAVRAADFLTNDRYVAFGTRIGIPPDAWLVQALTELDVLAPDASRRAYAFAIGRLLAREQLVDTYAPADLYGAPDAASSPGVIKAGARGEALGAAATLERRHQPEESFFLERLRASCAFALRNQYTEELLFGLRDPGRALGGFRSSPDEAVIRIDGVQHNLSALVWLLELEEASR